MKVVSEPAFHGFLIALFGGLIFLNENFLFWILLPLCTIGLIFTAERRMKKKYAIKKHRCNNRRVNIAFLGYAAFVIAIIICGAYITVDSVTFICSLSETGHASNNTITWFVTHVIFMVSMIIFGFSTMVSTNYVSQETYARSITG